MKKPAEAKRYATQVEAEAEKFRITAEAQGRAEANKAQGLADADVVLARGKAEAEAIRLKGEAEADVVKAKGLAEAEAMRKKAESYRDYNAAAVAEMVVNMLPSLAKAVADPLSKMEKMVIVSTGADGAAQGTGAARVTRDVTTLMAQLPPVVESLSGVNLKELIARIPGLTDKASAPAPAPGNANVVKQNKVKSDGAS